MSDFESLYFPKISNYQNIGGFHYGIPFFCYSEIILKKLKNEFKILKYNWPILDISDYFCDPDKFIELVYKDQIESINVFGKSNDLRDQLYFFDLKQIKNLNVNHINDKIISIKKNEN